MKKRSLIIAAGLIAAALCGCSGKKEQAPEPVGLVKEGVLTVAIIDGEDGYARTQEDGFVGAEPYLAELFAKEQGLTTVYTQASSQDELLDLIDAGQADMALGRISRSFEGSESYALSRTYGKGGLYLVTRTGNYADTLVGFSGETVGFSDLVTANLSTQIPLMDTVTPVSFSEIGTAAETLKKGDYAALICTEREAFSVLADEGVQVQELLNSPRESYCGVFPAGNTEMAGQFGAAITEYQDSLAAGELIFGSQAEIVSADGQGGE